MSRFFSLDFSILFALIVLAFQQTFAQQAELVTYTLTHPETVRVGDTVEVGVTIAVADGWYVYAPTALNEQQGMQATRVQFQPLPPGLGRVGVPVSPVHQQKGAHAVYVGQGHTFTQRFVIKESGGESISLIGKLVYQACNDQLCYPPVTERLEITFRLGDGGADAAWTAVEQAGQLFADSMAYVRYTQLRPLAMKRHEDQVHQRMARTSYEFLQQHPDHPRATEALYAFLGADPLFIADTGNEMQDTLTKINKAGWKRLIRSLAIDTLARDRWLGDGNRLVGQVLAASDSASLREAAAFMVFARDFRLAFRDYIHLPREEEENRPYWSQIEKQYWESMYQRFLSHVHAFPDHANLGARASDFLTNLKGSAPALAAQYWQQLHDLAATITPDAVGMASLRQTARKQLESLGVAQGNAPVQMAFQALDGREVDLSSMHGKVVLVDFWATWCKPCVEELPHLKTLYAQYRDRGFEIVGICLDDQSAKARAGRLLEKHGVPWPQRFEGAGFGADAYRLLYGINSLPTVWLLDKQGRVVDRNARGPRLEALIREHLEITP